MLIVGLTGNVASGKSTVAGVWRDAGIPVVSSDELAREAVEPGSEGLRAVREAFGDDVLSPDGTLDRAALRERVFRDEDARRTLEGILHPIIHRLQEEWIEARRREGAGLVVAEIPLLFEVGREDDFDVTVLVDAPAEVRLARMVRGRDLDPAEARRIMAAQMDPAEKRRRADLVVESGGPMEEMRARALATLDVLRARAAAPGSSKPAGPSGSPEPPRRPSPRSEDARGDGPGAAS